jgi:two-component system chemotaxis response regulator CheY
MNGKKKILIVDDMKFVRNDLRKIIEQTDFAEVVGEAEDGYDAIQKYKNLKPDLVTMDLIMPRMNGVEAIEKIMNYDNDALIIVISMVGNDKYIMDATQKGARDYLRKPFDQERIIEVLKHFLIETTD